MNLNISYSFSPTTTIESGQVNQNFTDIVNYINNTASPAGLVAGWKGSIASIPTGWVLDDDLKDRMIIGAGNLYAYAATGGAATHTLQTTEIPSHLHTVDPPATNTGGQSADHSHTVVINDDTVGSGYAGSDESQNLQTRTTSGASNDHTHTVDIAQFNSGNAGGGGAHNNLPPYYALAWIRRT